MKRKGVIWASVVLGAVAVGLVLFFVLREREVPPELTTIKVAYIPISVAAPLYVAVEEGFFPANLKVELTLMRAGSAILEAVGAGSLDVGFSNVQSLLFARAAGIDFVSLGGAGVNDKNHDDGAILVRDDSGITSVADLKGKTIAINASKNVVDLSVRRLLRKNGISSSDVTLVEIPFPQMEPTLKSGQIDAATVPEPFWSYAEQHGGFHVIARYFIDVYDRLEISTFAVEREWASKYPGTAKAVQDALAKAVTFLNDPRNETRVRAIIGKYTSVDAETAARMRLPAYAADVTEAGMQRIVDDMLAEGFITQTIAVKNIVWTGTADRR